MKNESHENKTATDNDVNTDREAKIGGEVADKEAQPSTNNNERSTQAKPLTKKQLFLQLLIFTACMASAGVIQFVTTGLLSTWTGLMKSEQDDYYWCAYLAGLVLSVIWSFTFNRKFTFKAASNLPLAMALVALYYCAFAPLSTFGADAIVDAWKAAAGTGWDENYKMVITVAMMLINFVTEYLWEKFIVFNDSVMTKIERKLHIKRKNKTDEKENDDAVTEKPVNTTPTEEAAITVNETATDGQTAPPPEKQNNE